MARSTVNTEGTRLRSSSVKTTALLGHVEADESFRGLGDRDVGKAGERLADHRQQCLATAVQRLDAHSAAKAEITSGGSMMAVSQRV